MEDGVFSLFWLLLLLIVVGDGDWFGWIKPSILGGFNFLSNFGLKKHFLQTGRYISAPPITSCAVSFVVLWVNDALLFLQLVQTALNFVTFYDIKKLHEIESYYSTQIEELPDNVAF